jgi:hypothetical protein
MNAKRVIEEKERNIEAEVLGKQTSLALWLLSRQH